MKLKKSLKILTLFFISWFLVHSFCITIDGLSAKGCQADVAVIMGNKVNEDGTLSVRLKMRMECGLKLYQSHRVRYLIVSGGLGKEGFYEADKMKDYLIANAVPDSAIIVDNHGDNTLNTVKNSIIIAKARGFKSLVVVSQFYHLTRSKMLFRHSGFKNVCSATPKYFEPRDIFSLFREFFAYYAQLF